MKKLPTLLLLTACCVSASAAAAEGEKNATGRQGFVALRVFANTLDIEPHTWTHLVVLTGTDKELKLEIKASDSRHTSKIFAGYLPEGNYRLKSLIGMKSNPEIGPGFEFAVKQGALTNLGTVIYQPIGEGKATFVMYGKPVALARTVAKEFPALAKDLSDTTVLGWGQVAAHSVGASGQEISSPLGYGLTGSVLFHIADKMSETEKRVAWADAKDPALRVMLSKTSTYSLNAAQELPDGELLVGSNLGQLLSRSKSGEWTNIDLDDPREITALYARDRKHITVGGEEGMLKQSTDGGLTWMDLEFPVENGLIAHMTEINGELLVMSLAQGRLYVHGRMNTPGSRWSELANLAGMGTLPYASLPSRATIHKGKYLLVLPGKEMHVFDLAQRTWTVSPVPQEIKEVTSTGESLYAAGFFQKPYVSQDDGASWSKPGNACGGFFSTLVYDFAMRDKNEAWSLCHVSGAFVTGSRIRHSKDGGKTWADLVDQTPVKTMRMVVTKSALLYIDRDARISSSADGGLTWTRDKRVLPQALSAAADGGPAERQSK
ncbi:hypothetical protein INH39_30635 [Massilia violaceinigra]|uniref:Photosynthesis system II assembly factor Ycf48/Hcf136-like domain-containing protein n=1 Tax=Massilia violaceinigra TaxID=2045208 RepID=A0ABY4A5M0_9BURK|nr:hypothetical protein [Massilia violaceinigra]UOD29692.1 hypothetical protein INH39_30635 [Massilia violaceinigra]